MKLSGSVLVWVLVAMVGLSSCVTEDTPGVANDLFVPQEEDSLVVSASFVSDDHPTSGTVEVFKNSESLTVSISNFKSDNGPDLRVYLSTSLGDSDFIELGELIAVSGSFSYKANLDTDLTRYKNVLIWCQDFDVLFGHAVLE